MDLVWWDRISKTGKWIKEHPVAAGIGGTFFLYAIQPVTKQMISDIITIVSQPQVLGAIKGTMAAINGFISWCSSGAAGAWMRITHAITSFLPHLVPTLQVMVSTPIGLLSLVLMAIALYKVSKITIRAAKKVFSKGKAGLKGLWRRVRRGGPVPTP